MGDKAMLCSPGLAHSEGYVVPLCQQMQEGL